MLKFLPDNFLSLIFENQIPWSFHLQLQALTIHIMFNDSLQNGKKLCRFYSLPKFFSIFAQKQHPIVAVVMARFFFEKFYPLNQLLLHHKFMTLTEERLNYISLFI